MVAFELRDDHEGASTNEQLEVVRTNAPALVG